MAVTNRPTRTDTSAAGDSLELFDRWQNHGDAAAREQLLERFMPLARSLARRYQRSSEPFEDLLQVASVGLINAIDRFDASRGSRFASFAVPTILGEMRRYFRDSGWAVHVPRGAQERALKVRDAHEALVGEHGHSPTVSQLAQFLEIDTEHVLDALQAIQAYETVSLDAPHHTDDEDGVSYSEAIGAEDERFEFVELDTTVAGALKHISQRERKILQMRFFEELTQTEIAETIGVSQMQVSRILRQTIERLRTLSSATP
jgi:RNA polymerase sigma-B factor